MPVDVDRVLVRFRLFDRQRVYPCVTALMAYIIDRCCRIAGDDQSSVSGCDVEVRSLAAVDVHRILRRNQRVRVNTNNRRVFALTCIDLCQITRQATMLTRGDRRRHDDQERQGCFAHDLSLLCFCFGRAERFLKARISP